jgi:predicted transposase YbfD/YdcC
VLPVVAAGIQDEWPTVQQICRVRRIVCRKKKGQWQKPQEETAYLITSLAEAKATPKNLLGFNRIHWSIEIMHRNKDVFLQEDWCTNRKDNAPSVMFVLNNLTLTIGKTVSSSPTQALEYFQDNKNRAIKLVS